MEEEAKKKTKKKALGQKDGNGTKSGGGGTVTPSHPDTGKVSVGIVRQPTPTQTDDLGVTDGSHLTPAASERPHLSSWIVGCG